MVEFERDRLIAPSCTSATLTAVFKNAFAQKPALEFMRLNGQGIIEIALDRLFWRKFLSLIPRLTGEVRRIKAKMSNCLPQHVVVAAIWSNMEYL